MNGLLGNAAYYLQRSQPGGLLPAGPASFQGGGGGRTLSAPSGVQVLPSRYAGLGEGLAALGAGIGDAADAYRARKLKEEANKAVMDIFAGKPVTRTGSVPMMEQTPVPSQISDPSVLAQTVANRQGGSVASFPLGTNFQQAVTPQDVNLYEETSVPDAREFTVTGRVPYSKDEVRAKILGNPALMELNPKFGMSMLEKMLAPTTYDFKAVDKKLYRTNAATGEAELVSGQAEAGDMFDPDEREKYVSGLIKDYNKDTSDMRQSGQAVSRMVGAAQRGTPQSDIALIFDFFKAIDPNSTVREGEFATAETARGLGSYMRGLLLKADRGEKLLPAERQAFINEARGAYDAKVNDYRGIRKSYELRANRIGEDPAILFPDFAQSSQPPSFDPLPTEATATTIQSANTVEQIVELGAMVTAMQDGPEKQQLWTMLKNRAAQLGIK